MLNPSAHSPPSTQIPPAMWSPWRPVAPRNLSPCVPFREIRISCPPENLSAHVVTGGSVAAATEPPVATNRYFPNSL